MNDNRIASGRTAEVYDYGQGQVLKLFYEGLPEHQIEAEYQAGLIVRCAGIPAPAPIARIRHGERLGIVYEKVSGTTMLAALAQRPGEVADRAGQMAALHAHMHSQSAPGLPAQKTLLGERIGQASLLNDEEKARILALLDRLPDGDRLCHGDYHPDNIVLGTEDAQTWIIDWMTGMSGHPAGDAARTALLLQYGTVPDGASEEVVEWLARMRAELLEGYLRTYTQHTGTTREYIEQWMVPVAAARLCEWIPDAEKQALAAFIRQSIAAESNE
ncbi:phosphotransferase family protein [Cohnella sp. 56]|uniref:phosphotransferase family protein n=1 Tax=Cohnella sp. 56 TaxID=3113722 RepID=UPI0030EAFCDE